MTEDTTTDKKYRVVQDYQWTWETIAPPTKGEKGYEGPSAPRMKSPEEIRRHIKWLREHMKKREFVEGDTAWAFCHALYWALGELGENPDGRWVDDDAV